MSEYQYYEFLAVDRPLSAEEMAELPLSDSRPDHAHHLRQRLHVGQLQGRRGGGKVRASRVRRKTRQPHQVALTAPRWPLGGVA